MTTKQKTKVGEKVILLTNSREEPKVTEISRVTPTGQFYVSETAYEKIRFKWNEYDGKADNVGGSRYSPHRSAVVYYYNPAKYAKLLAEHLKIKQEDEEEHESKIKEQKERETRHRIELDEVRRLVSFQDVARSVLPDGSRLYQVLVLGSEDMGERKGGFDYVLVHCNDSPDTYAKDTNKKQDVEMSYGRLNGRCVRFTVSSSARFENDEDAVYEAIRSAYFGW